MSKPTRIEAARYLGMRTIEGIRYLERAGKLHPTKDDGGVHRFDPAELERVKQEREGEGTTARLTTEDLARLRPEREVEAASYRGHRAWGDRLQAEARAEALMDAEVKRRNELARAKFDQDHLDEQTTAAALGFDVLERSLRLHALVRAGLLREVRLPLYAQIVRGPAGEPLGVEQGDTRMYIPGRPFFLRAEVLTLRNDPVRLMIARVPGPVRQESEGQSTNVRELMALLMSLRGQRP
jgi:hypothetical protein